MNKLLAAAALAFAAALTSPAKANFIIDPDPGGAKFFIDVANKNVSSFSGLVGSNTSGPVVNVTTVGNVDTGSGYSNIKPTDKRTILSDLIFTPVDPTLFSDFSFRGQLDQAGDITVKVTDNQGNPAQTFTFTITKANADFDRIGIVSLDGETIKSVEISNPSFKEVKQIDFSGGGIPVPEPASMALLGAGLLGLGAFRRRRTRI